MNLSIRSRLLLVLPTVAMLFIGVGMTQAKTPASGSQAYRINAIKCEESGKTFALTIKGDASPTYTKYELFNPLRIVIDIADATLAKDLTLPMEVRTGPVDKITGQLLDTKKPFVTRLEIFLQEDRGYTVARNNNDIVVNFSPAEDGKTNSSLILQKISVTKDGSETRVHLTTNGPVPDYQEAKLPQDADYPARFYIDLANIGMADVPQQIEVGSTLARIRTASRNNGLRIVFDSGVDPLFTYRIDSRDDGLLVTIAESASAPATETVQEEMAPAAAEENQVEATVAAPAGASAAKADNFRFSGYNAQRITVDFFKIDLHNVFRLLGEISGRNMVIEESVNGTLTLALSDVPWDFVLDVVLNLKDLQKEERFNTIVISPKSKGFIWPERASDKLAIRSGGGDGAMAQESLSIKKRIETPKGVIEAKKLLQAGNVKYTAGNYAGALADFESASNKWPENNQLAKRIAALCLVQLGQNAKAVHYAKLALKTDPKDSEAALQAAIGLANMKKTATAKEYFDLAISGPHPSSEALASYAAFNEENKNYVATLLLLSKHTELYGDNMETMLSKARIYDKQGDVAKAAKEYQSLLLSGYDIPADLKRYIKGRLSLINK
ncbi:MAG: AMIN domain-containing protein [Desulfobulbaceae bacterium]|nr:AMIN domain-containing protein [Desulfobulbaceae bacterium]